VDGTRPTIQASTTSVTILTTAQSHLRFDYLIADGNTQATTSGFVSTNNYVRYRYCKAMRTTVRGFYLNSTNQQMCIRCEATTCSGTAGFELPSAGALFYCEAYANTIHGFKFSGGNGIAIGCISSANTGGSTDGFNTSSIGYAAINCTAYGNGRDGFNLDGNAHFGSFLSNCLSYGNTGEGFGTDGVKTGVFLLNCGAGSNTAGNYNVTNITNLSGFATLTGDPFTNAGSGDFSLDSTASEGAACRGAGYPGLMVRGLSTGYVDIGAIQHQDPAGGGGGSTRVIGG
jgi:hypothetical protein